MPLPEPLLSRLSEHVAAQMGLHFPPDRWRDLESGIEAAARESGARDAAAYGRDLLAAKLSDEQIEVLAGALTIGETYFLRDPRSFDILAQHVFPDLIRARRGGEQRLRIWSAGCCTGEEAYSIAILLDRLLPDLSKWQITLLATDINSRFLRKAAEGVFGEWSFRGAPAWLKERYFRPLPGRRYALTQRIKSLVTFAYLNLGEDVYPSLTNNTNAMDLILCRNVLMYFSAERAHQVMRNFHRSLVSTGWFLVSAVETSPQFSSHFMPAQFEGATLYRKRNEFDTAAEPPRSDALFTTQDAANSWEEAAAVAPSHAFDFDAAAAPRAAYEAPAARGYEAALQLFEAGKYADAAVMLEADAAGVPEVRTATLFARIYANLGQLGEAHSWAERAIAADRTNAVSHYLFAVILQEQSLIEEATSALQKALYLEPNFVLAHFAMGILAQRQGRQAAAARHFGNASALLLRHDENAVLPHSDGMAAGRLKQMIEAISPVEGSA